MGGTTTPLDQIDAETARKLLEAALARGGDDADLYFEYRAGADYVLEEERVKTLGRGITLGLGVRVVAGEAMGYAYTEQLTLDRMLDAARTAAQIAREGGHQKPVPAPSVRANGADRYPLVGTKLGGDPGVKLDLLRRADRAARAADARITKVVASLAEELRDVLVCTADGKMARDTQPLIRFNVHVVAESGALRQSGSSGGGGRFGLEYFDAPGKSPEDHGREAVRVAIAMLDAQPAPAGELEVVLGPADSGILLHEAIGHGLEADFNRKQTSNYTDKVGTRVASPYCTVVDDGTMGRSRGSINVDDEGNEAQRNVLIEDGILREYMHDAISARHFKRGPSGNGRRQSFRHIPLPRMTNTCLLAGPHDPEEITRSVKRGVLARKFSGGQVNISNGDFVFSLTEGYLIEDGRVTAPLKGVNLIGNGPDVLTRVSMVGTDFELSDGIWTCGKDGQSVPVGVGTPTVKIDRITVGGTAR